MGFLELIGAYLGALFHTAGAVMRLDGAALSHAPAFGWAVPIGIAVVGGASIMIGQSAVLAINRVRRLRSGLTLVVSGLGLVLIGVVQAAILALLALLVIGNQPSLREVLPTILTSFAPYWWGFLVMLPYSGPGLARILQAWNLAALWVLIDATWPLGHWQSLFFAAAAWLGSMAVNWAFERSPIHLRHRIFTWVTGSRGLTGRDLLADVALPDDERADA